MPPLCNGLLKCFRMMPSKKTSYGIAASPVVPFAGENNSMAFCRELLQSYRLLFAQDKKSRGLFWNTIRLSIEKDKLYDSFLDDLCGRKISVIRGLHPELGQLLDIRGGVFGSSEFPTYSEHMYAIQNHVERHRPRRFREIWRDRRDLEKFSALWAVFVFGSISILLSIVQIGFNAVQLWVSYEQLHQKAT